MVVLMDGTYLSNAISDIAGKMQTDDDSGVLSSGYKDMLEQLSAYLHGTDGGGQGFNFNSMTKRLVVVKSGKNEGKLAVKRTDGRPNLKYMTDERFRVD
ncbi:MAG: hypothetical protein JW754_05100 [Candidatus Aenigmarchaeota archaeon]|nr:hypothetical protein [Candidatus Aenigmarchaeota archaeon]